MSGCFIAFHLGILSPATRLSCINVQPSPSLNSKLFAVLIVSLIGAAVVIAVIDWKRVLATVLIAAVLAVALASVLYIPALCYFAIATRSIRESFSRSWALWKHVASEVFARIN